MSLPIFLPEVSAVKQRRFRFAKKEELFKLSLGVSGCLKCIFS